MKPNQAVTEQQIQQAIQRFREAGGLIHKLPPEIVPMSRLVGAHLAMYERPIAAGAATTER